MNEDLEDRIISQFPDPEDDYDFVLTTKGAYTDENYEKAQLILEEKLGSRLPVGNIFWSGGNWCLRVKQ